MTTVTITTNSDATSSDAIGLVAALSASNLDSPLGVPAFIRADEAYYWSTPWQNDVKEALAARAAGDTARFASDDPDDVVRWLLNIDEES